MSGRETDGANQIQSNRGRTGVIEQKMKLVPTRNMESYLRKMAIDGYIIQIGP